MVPELHLCDSDSDRAVASRPATLLPDVLSITLCCARRGRPVQPPVVPRKTPPAHCHDCRKPGHSCQECPGIRAGHRCHCFHAAAIDAGCIRAWWAQQPEFEVGVACKGAGLDVIDVDAHRTPLPERDRLLPGIAIPSWVSLHGRRPGFHRLALAALDAGGGSRLAKANPATVLAPVLDCTAVAEEENFSAELNQAAHTASGLAATGHLAAQDARAALVAAAVHVRPGQERRTLHIVQSGMSAGSRRPLDLGDRR
ncbi:bifunctional DNA primase/polymerase [Streptomyces sp. NPDC048473]|uniref:bifunctional DNA primase/polymerase n=1 Tax=unclassified Streptomyces TaxID=2593676 RepID=UPI0037221021